MGTQHTPGPWEVSDVLPCTRVQCSARGEEICDTKYASEKSLGESTQNARLIAAGPEMFAALLPFVKFLSVNEQLGGTTPQTGELYTLISSRAGEASITVEDLQAARAAIAKATGAAS